MSKLKEVFGGKYQEGQSRIRGEIIGTKSTENFGLLLLSQ